MGSLSLHAHVMRLQGAFTQDNALICLIDGKLLARK